MAVWSISIVSGPNPDDPATFIAQNQSSAPPGTLYADAGDAVSWNNTTAQNHQPVQTNSNGQVPMPLGGLLWEPVTPGHQTPAWIVTGSAGTSITYTCLIHPQEQGTIAVT
jgi:plastocyanin